MVRLADLVVIVGLCPGIGLGARPYGLLGERRRPNFAAVLELQEESVAAGGGVVDLEGDRAWAAGLALRVGVQERLVVLAQRNQMTVGPEVGLD
jgi:hypothetical protein